MSREPDVRSHFDADARRFDAIYEDGKDPFSQWVDTVWRGVVRRRLELTVARLEPLAGKRVLDVGCGSGRFCIAFARAGAAQVVGLDFAPRMIEIARRLAKDAGVEARCEYHVGSFPADSPPGPFDAATALGYFDYIADPVPHLARMRELTRGRLVLSFPKAVEWRVPLRRARFLLSGCPLFLYREKQVRGLLERAGIQRYEWTPLDRDYLVVADV